MSPDIIEIVARAVEYHGLPARLVAAIIAQESAGKPWAWNPEPRYRYFWDVRARTPFRLVTTAEIASQFPPADFPALAGDRDQEWWAQQASWGLMQVMGAVAREHGYPGPYLTELCDPQVGVDYGCRHLSRLAQRHLDRVGWPGVIAAYNAGSPRLAANGRWVNQAYVDGVTRRMGGQ